MTARRKAGKPGGRYHHGDLRRALLRAALGLIERQGVQALTLRAAARRAGVTQAAPYRHFADKEALLAAVAEEGFRAMTARMRQAQAARGEGALERFHALGVAYVEFALDHPSHFRVMFGRAAGDRSAHPGLREAAEETFTLLLEAVQACQRAGLLRSDPAEELAISAWSMVHGLAALLVDDQLARLTGHRPAEVADIVARDLVLGLGVR